MKLKRQKELTGEPVLFNRDGGEFKMPEDGWYHIIPKGEFVHKPTGLIQVIDESACKEIMNRFEAEANAKNFPGILVDYDHFSQDTDKPSEAAGWITALDNRDDGVWAQIRWSDKGAEAVKGGRYRLVSPVWKRTDCDSLDNGRVRPRRLDSVALTNDPNLKGLVPLSNRSSSWEKDAELDYKLELTSLLGLPAEATDEEIKQALDEKQHAPAGAKKKAGKADRGVKNRSNHMADEPEVNSLTEKEVEEILSNREAEFETEREALNNRLQSLQAQYEKLLNAQVDADLETYASVINDPQTVKEMLMQNREATVKLLKSLKDRQSETQKAVQKPLHNRDEASLPEGHADESLAKKIQNRAREIMTSTRIAGRPATFHQAFNMAKGEFAKE